MTRTRWKQRHRNLRRPTTLNAAPGTLTTDPNAPPPAIRAIGYGPAGYEEQELKSPEDVKLLMAKWPVTWVDIDGLGRADILQAFGRIFALHPLALEDTVNTHQRAKADFYDNVIFITSRMIEGPPLVSEQLSLFLGKTFVLTFQEDKEGDCFNGVRERIRSGRGQLRTSGPDYLVYELLDAVIDGFFPVLEAIGEQLDELETRFSEGNFAQAWQEIHALRTDLLFLRRTIWPHRDLLQQLIRAGHHGVSASTLPYLNDCYDHIAQIIDVVELYRESCADLRDFFYTQLSNRTNDIMRTLTVISTVFLPLSFIASIYGMNFDNIPELHWRYGYPFVLALMAFVAFTFLGFAWRRGWLRRWDRP